MRSLALVLPVLMVVSGAVQGQHYPTKPIRVLTTEAGGGGDIVARIVGQGMSNALGQPVIIDNRGIRAAEMVALAPRDGYTLLSYGNPLWLAPFLRTEVPYDPVKDFAPISLTVSSPNVLVLSPAAGAGSVKELVALARAKPGELNYASSGVGSSNHLAAELFKAMTGVNIVHVPYKGAGPALTALVGGHVQLMFPSASSVMPHIKSGKLKGLAVTSTQPSPLAPGLPTLTGSGVPGYESSLILALFGPAGTPRPVIRQLNEVVVKLLKSPEVADRLMNAGVEAVGSTPDALAARVKSEMSRLGKVIKDAGIRAD